MRMRNTILTILVSFLLLSAGCEKLEPVSDNSHFEDNRSKYYDSGLVTKHTVTQGETFVANFSMEGTGSAVFEIRGPDADMFRVDDKGNLGFKEKTTLKRKSAAGNNIYRLMVFVTPPGKSRIIRRISVEVLNEVSLPLSFVYVIREGDTFAMNTEIWYSKVNGVITTSKFKLKEKLNFKRDFFDDRTFTIVKNWHDDSRAMYIDKNNYLRFLKPASFSEKSSEGNNLHHVMVKAASRSNDSTWFFRISVLVTEADGRKPLPPTSLTTGSSRGTANGTRLIDSLSAVAPYGHIVIFYEGNREIGRVSAGRTNKPVVLSLKHFLGNGDYEFRAKAVSIKGIESEFTSPVRVKVSGIQPFTIKAGGNALRQNAPEKKLIVSFSKPLENLDKSAISVIKNDDEANPLKEKSQYRSGIVNGELEIMLLGSPGNGDEFKVKFPAGSAS